jgi:nucleotide-binding universal stress UspA family protein
VHLQQTSEAAAELAAAIAKREGGELHFLIVCGEADRDAAESKVDDIASRLAIDSKKVIITGEDVEREVVRYVAESNADAVFVNAQREIGAVKQEIIRHISTPVMIVPAK